MSGGEVQKDIQVEPGFTRVASLDLGTNTFLLLIADINLKTGEIKTVRDEVRIVRLGQDVDRTKRLHPEALARAEVCFKEFSQIINEVGSPAVQAVATSATRDASNGTLLVELGQGYGIPIRVISGEQEAELTYKGTILSSSSGLTAVIDVGGGSTEVIIGDQRGIIGRASANVGSVRLTEKYVTKHPTPDTEIAAIKECVRMSLLEACNRLERATTLQGNWRSQIKSIIAVAGTPTTLASVSIKHRYEASLIDGLSLQISDIEKQIKALAAMTIAERTSLVGMEPQRADVIVAGAVCLSEAAKILSADRLAVSIRGLRYGLAYAMARKDGS